jgi:hypothetical protein
MAVTQPIILMPIEVISIPLAGEWSAAHLEVALSSHAARGQRRKRSTPYENVAGDDARRAQMNDLLLACWVSPGATLPSMRRVRSMHLRIGQGVLTVWCSPLRR